MALDRETNPNYRLTAKATDGGGRWCRAEVQLVVTDVNDNPPLFTLSQYYVSVYEDTPVKALLTRIHAVDPDEGDDRLTVTAQLAVIADNVVITNLTAWPNIYRDILTVLLTRQVQLFVVKVNIGFTLFLQSDQMHIYIMKISL